MKNNQSHYNSTSQGQALARPVWVCQTPIRLKSDLRYLRKNMTKAEACLWKYVLRGKSLGYGFRRQRPIGKYIADFMCIPLKLIIEVDGITHTYEETVGRDINRQKELEALGFFVVRYQDEDVLGHIDRVRNHLLKVIKEREKDLPLTSSKGGGQDKQLGSL